MRILKVYFHTAVTAFGDTLTFYPLPRHSTRPLEAMVDYKRNAIVLTKVGVQEEILVPLTNVVFYACKKPNKSTAKRTSNKSKVVQDKLSSPD